MILWLSGIAVVCIGKEDGKGSEVMSGIVLMYSIIYMIQKSGDL